MYILRNHGSVIIKMFNIGSTTNQLRFIQKTQEILLKANKLRKLNYKNIEMETILLNLK